MPSRAYGPSLQEEGFDKTYHSSSRPGALVSICFLFDVAAIITLL